ncbi:hypothetical protein PG993_011675 [Apiospora rasikravindrae]|uniref:Uncharacterized protein n=1 Tax=Apiospora rasikravindrae TaxID=990691 RepID=A0ABR1S0A6_9PEZI
MKAVLIGVLAVFAGVVTAQEEAAAVTAAAVLDDAGALEQAAACPTVTKSIVDPKCAQNCNNDCRLVTTVTNGCGCPASVPTATLVAPCGGECPNAGCDIIYRTKNEACGPPRPTKRTSTTTTATSPTSSPVVITSIIILPPRPTKTSLPCPTVIRTTQPADCTPIRCPIPGCTEHTSLVVPCGCDGPKTIIAVQGCQSTCPGGCITRTTTASELCATAA